MDKIIGKGWEIFIEKEWDNARLLDFEYLVIAGDRSDGYDAGVIKNKKDYLMFRKSLEEFAKQLGWE